MAKNGQVHEGEKVGRSSATPTKLFSVDSYDLKSMSFNFCNDNFSGLEMPEVNWENEHFSAFPSICNQRSLNNLSNRLIKC